MLGPELALFQLSFPQPTALTTMQLLSIPNMGFLCKAHHCSVFALEPLEASLCSSPAFPIHELQLCEEGPRDAKSKQIAYFPNVPLIVFVTMGWFCSPPWLWLVRWRLGYALRTHSAPSHDSAGISFLWCPWSYAWPHLDELRFTRVWRRSAKYHFGVCFEKCSTGMVAFIWLEFLMSLPGKT